MTEQTQYELFKPTRQQQFDEWKKTEFGRWVCYQFIRMACATLIQGRKQTGRGIWEDIREIYMNQKWPKNTPPKVIGSKYALADQHFSYLVRLALKKKPELSVFLKIAALRSQQTGKKRKAVVIPIKDKP